MPAGVWARSVSASEIEVNWQALSNSPERVLGYEVHFSLLNGNRNHTHTQHDSNACQRPCRSFEPSLTAKIIQFFVAARQENISECFQREQKEKRPSTWTFLCNCQPSGWLAAVGCIAALESQHKLWRWLLLEMIQLLLTS